MATPGVHSRLVVLLSLGGCCGLVLGRATPWHLSLSTGQAPDEDPQRKQPDTPFASLCLSFIPHEPALGPLVGVPGGDVSAKAHRRHQGPCPLTSCRELSNLGSPPRGGGEGEWDPTKCALAMRIAASERGTCGGGAPRTPSSSPRGPASAPGESEEGPRSCLIGEQLPSREAIPFRLQTASPAACTSPAPLGGLRKL